MTIYDIATKLKVSPATVSMALNGDLRIAEKTRQRIRDFAEKSGFQRNEQARNFRLKRTNTIGVVVYDIASGFWSGVVKAVENEMGRDYSVVVCNSDGDSEKEKKLVETLKSRQVDGIIIQPTSRNIRYLEELNRSGIPVVLFEKTDSDELSFVKGNDYDAAYNLTRECIDDGHKKIAFLSFQTNVIGVQDRICGFSQACRDYGIDDCCELFIAADISVAAVQKVLSDRLGKFSLVICCDDRIACMLLKLSAEEGTMIPDEISVIGWNNSPFLEYLETPLASLSIPVGEMGRNAALIIKNYHDGHKEAVKYYIKEEIVYRKSYKKLR